MNYLTLDGSARHVEVPETDPTRVICEEVWTLDCYRFAEHAAGTTLVDLGANVGIATLAALAHGAVRVIAVEPDAINRAMLVENLERNGVSDLVEIRTEAVAGREGSRIVRRRGDGCSGTSWTDPTDEPGAARVEALPLVEFVPPDADRLVLKVDVEGSEYDAFSGAPDWLLDRFEWITIEYHHDPRRGLDAFRRLPALLARLLVAHDFEVVETFTPGVGMVWANRRVRQ